MTLSLSRLYTSRGRFSVVLLIFEAVTLLILNIVCLWEPTWWATQLAERKLALLVLLATNLVIVSLLLTDEIFAHLSAGRVALLASAVIAYYTAIGNLSNPNTLESLVVALAFYPTFMAIGVWINFFWHLSVGMFGASGPPHWCHCAHCYWTG